jgi:hypothetical protein
MINRAQTDPDSYRPACEELQILLLLSGSFCTLGGRVFIFCFQVVHLFTLINQLKINLPCQKHLGARAPRGKGHCATQSHGPPHRSVPARPSVSYMWYNTMLSLTEVRSPTEAKDFSPSSCVQTSSEVHPASCPMGTGVLSGGKKRPRRDADHTSPSNTEVKDE